MVALRVIIEKRASSPDDASDDEQRVTNRSRVLMRAIMRIRGAAFDYPVTIKDISSTGLRATTNISMFTGTRIEIELKNIGWVPGEVVWADAEGQIGVRFDAVIQPERTQNQITGTYRAPPKPSLYRL